MGNLGKNFRRFPHTCRITYFDGQITSFDSDEEIEAKRKVLFEGICRKEYMSNGTGQDHVITADYRIQLGKIENGKEVGAVVEGIKAGMELVVTDLSDTHTLEIKDVYAGQLGTSVFCGKANT